MIRTYHLTNDSNSKVETLHHSTSVLNKILVPIRLIIWVENTYRRRFMMKKLTVFIVFLLSFFLFSQTTFANSSNQFIIINKATNQLAYYNNGKIVKTLKWPLKMRALKRNFFSALANFVSRETLYCSLH